MKINKCRKCDEILTDGNWYPSHKKNRSYVCIKCSKLNGKEYRHNNIEKIRQDWRDTYYRMSGGSSSRNNKSCSNYLGIVISERILSDIFENVVTMPPNNKGYDFICNSGKKIDVKSSCKTKLNGWNFYINKNKIAEYFLCLAFDNREDLNPVHIWMIPPKISNDKHTIGISESTISKWNKYRLDINKVIHQCNIIRGGYY